MLSDLNCFSLPQPTQTCAFPLVEHAVWFMNRVTSCLGGYSFQFFQNL